MSLLREARAALAAAAEIVCIQVSQTGNNDRPDIIAGPLHILPWAPRPNRPALRRGLRSVLAALLLSLLLLAGQTTGAVAQSSCPGGDPVTVNVTANSATIDEGDTAYFTVRIDDPGVKKPIHVWYRYELVGAGAIENGAFALSKPGTRTRTYPFETENDNSETDGVHEYKLTLLPSGNEELACEYQVGASFMATVRVRDNNDDADPPPPMTMPVASFAHASSSASEDAGKRNVRVTLSPAPQSGIALSYTVGGTATAGDDFAIAGSGSVTAPAEATHVDIPVTIANDGTDEPDETVVLTLTGGTGYTVGSTSVHTLTIGDDDDPPLPPPPPTPEVSIAGGSAVTEGGNAEFTLTASPAPTGGIAVNVVVTQSGSFAASGQTGTRTVNVGTSGTASFTVGTDNDGTDEPNGAITVAVRTGGGYSPHNTDASATVTVNDDDDPPLQQTPSVSLSAVPNPVTEGQPVTVTVRLSRALSAPVTIPLALTAGTAEAGDYGTLASVTVAAGQTAGTGTVATQRDGDAEDETFTVALGSLPAVVQAGNPSSVGVTIRDLDAVRRVSIADGSAMEGGAVVFTVRVSPPHPEAITLDWTRSHGTTDADDFPGNAAASGTVTVPAGAGSATFSVATSGDEIDEDVETFTVMLSGVLPANTSFLDDTATGAVRDDDTAGILLSRSSLRIAEESGAAEYEVRLKSEPMGDVTVALTSSDEATATVSSHRLTFVADDWDRPQTVTITAGTDRGETTVRHTASSPDDNYNGLVTMLRVRLGQDPVSAAAAWLARFARAHAGHVLDGIAERLRAAPEPGGEVQLAGRPVEPAPDSGSSFGERNGAGAESSALTGREALTGSSFALTGDEASDGSVWSVWGRGAQSRFDSREGALSLDGGVTTTVLGADRRRGRWLMGLMLTHSSGEGDYSGLDEGRGGLKADLTAVAPWASMQATDRITAWGALGYGRGAFTLTPEGGGTAKADAETWMAALGARGTAVEAPAAGGFGLALVLDALWLRAESGEAGEVLAATSADASRLRMGLEGTWTRAIEGAGRLAGRLELGARHDGGDAETGFGAELGGGVFWADRARGLDAALEGRGLLAHDASGFRDTGVSAAAGWDPAPASARGPSLRLWQDWGGTSSGDRILAPKVPGSGAGEDSVRRLSVEAAYGFPAFGGRFAGSPHAGFGLAAGARDYTLGWRLVPDAASPDLSFGLMVTRRESDSAAPEHRAGVEMAARW